MNVDTNLSDQYRILRKLGNDRKRKFSSVYLVEDRINEKQFVLKIANSALGIERLSQESSFSFERAGLPRIVEFKEGQDEAYLILEYKSGETWSDYLKMVPRKNQFQTILRLLEGLVPILDELKQQRIAHLDIKPSNLLYSKEDNRVSLIDFGLSFRYQDETLRKTIFPLGYAAPELLLNRLHLVDQRTDYFALAISLYQLIEGKIPLVHANPSITTNLQLTHPLLDAERLDNKANVALQKLATKHAFKTAPNRMLVKDVDIALIEAMNHRYSDISEFISDFAKGKIKRFWFL